MSSDSNRYDDATACGSLKGLRSWWDKLTSEGPGFGYFPNPSKTCIIVKDGLHDAAISAFQGTGVSITSDGKRHLGAALGSPSFITSFAEKQVTSRGLRNCSNCLTSLFLILKLLMLHLHMGLLVNGTIS